MKKRILSLLLALVTVFYILPIGSIPAIATEEYAEDEGISIEDMEVGKLYSAKWDYTNIDFIPFCLDDDGESMIWKGFPEIYEDEAYVLKNDFPQSLIIKRMNADEEAYVYVTNEDWPEEYNNYRYVDELELTITGEYTPPADDGYIYGKVGIFCEDAVDGTLTLGKGEKVQAFTELDAEISENAKYQWQMKLEDDRWAAITDCFYSWINISEALITNAKGENATLRCAVTDGTKKYASEELKVAMEPEINAVYAGANGAGSFTEGLKGTNTLNADDQAFQASINYIFVHATRKAGSGTDDKIIDGTNAAAPFIHTFYIESDELTATIASPFVMGYTACVLDENGTIAYDGKKYTAKPSHYFDHVNMNSSESELSITIYYVPNEVEFTVEYYEQNLANDTYSLAGRVRKKGRTDDYVGEVLDEDREGFKSLYYDSKTTISGDEGTIVEIYYDRIYYLVDFILGDGGYGATPYYVRYGTSVMLPKPTKPGYVFVDPWKLNRVYTVADDKTETNVTITDSLKADYDSKNAGSLIVVKNNVEYLANWNVSTTNYTIVYYLENADSADSSKQNNYDVWYTVPMPSTTGATTIVGGDNIVEYVVTQNLVSDDAKADVNLTYKYLTYESSLSDTASKTVSGDGSTTINIYYSRNEYYIKFYYARFYNGTWYVANSTSGSSDQGGTVQASSWGTSISEMPVISDESPLKDYYTEEISGNINPGTYYYMKLTAKYGADLQGKWPADVISNILYSGGKEIRLVSWSTQHGSGYYNSNSNKNIKGTYQKMDANIIKDPDDEQAHFMAAYWNTDAQDLRYDVYYEALPGYTGTTVEYKGKNFVYVTFDILRATSYETTQQTDLKYEGVQELDKNTWRRREDGRDGIAYVYSYYFERLPYLIRYNDRHGNTVTKQVLYGTSLNTDEFKATPSYPSSVEVGQYNFLGWYIDEACQIPFEFEVEVEGAKTDKTMPAKNIQLYAKWEITKKNVKIYNQKGDATALVDTTVDFGSSIKDKEPTYTLPDKNSVFDGWYYEQDGEEYRFDFNTMVIKDDYVIYAKWAKNVQIAYTVRYVINNGTADAPVYVEIGKPESGYSLAGVSKTFTAKMGDELYDGYKTWYFPNDRYITHLMQEDEASNTITFVYQTATEIKYTIEHIFVSDKFETYLGTGNKTIEYVTNYTMTQSQTFQATITERFDNLVQSDLVKAYLKAKYTGIGDTQADSMWNIISAMNADYFVQEMDLTLDENKNVMTFNWVESDATKTYQIVHYLQNKDLSTYSVIYSRSITVQNDNNLDITEVWRDQLGFKRSAFKISGTAQSVDLTQPSVTIKLGAAEKLIMEFYYDRELYTYIVHHYVNGTTTKIVDDDVYDGDPVTMAKAYYEQEIKVGDVDRDLSSNGYLIANSTTVYTVKSDDFEVRCFYNPMDVYFRYQEAISGRGSLSRVTYTGKVNTTVDADAASCTATAKTGYRFVGWYLDVNGNQSVDTYATVSDDGATITPKTPTSDMANGTYIFYALFEPTTRVFKNSGVTDANQAFVYRIQGLDTGNSYVDVTFVITGNGQVTLAMLPYGKYRVTLLSWSWRYDVPAGWTSTIWELTMSTPDAVVFDYSSVTPTDQWLTDDANDGSVTPGS